MTPISSRFTARFELKATERRTFEGLLSTWDLDSGGDKVVPGAFKRWLGEWKRSGRTVPLIDTHGNGGEYSSVRQVVGKLMDAEETDEGLSTKWYVLDSPEGDEYHARVKQGLLDEMSMGYSAIGHRKPNEDEAKAGVRRWLTDVDVKEGSLVIWGMNSNARINTMSVKSINDTLANMKREALTDDDRKMLRQVASLSGALLRPLSPPEESAAATDDGEVSDPPEAPPGNAADAQKAKAVPVMSDEENDALMRELLAFQLKQTLNAA
jgi:HK97 family phage prohead protease